MLGHVLDHEFYVEIDQDVSLIRETLARLIHRPFDRSLHPI